jgi:hypothetical protein
LFPLYTGKSFEELLDGIARLQMIEQTLYRNSRPGKNRFATEDLRILRNNAAHEQNYALETQSIQANITDLSRPPLAKNFGVALAKIEAFSKKESSNRLAFFLHPS